MISGFLGTLRHAAINRDDPNFLIEQRFFDDIGSGQIDSFWIPAAMLIELKTVKSYKLKKILETGLGPGSEGYFYALQINRNADLMEHSGATDRVQHLRLEFLPPDLTKATSPGLQKALAAATMDTTITSVVTLDVPRLPTAETTRIYTEHRDEKSEAFNTGYTRICSPAETWDGKRCAEYCPVATECLAMSRTRNEAHYLAS
jgi:hypothetical protein